MEVVKQMKDPSKKLSDIKRSLHWAVEMARLLYHWKKEERSEDELRQLKVVLPTPHLLKTDGPELKSLEPFKTADDKQWNFWMEYAWYATMFFDHLRIDNTHLTEVRVPLKITEEEWWSNAMMYSPLNATNRADGSFASSVVTLRDNLIAEADARALVPVELVPREQIQHADVAEARGEVRAAQSARGLEQRQSRSKGHSDHARRVMQEAARKAAREAKAQKTAAPWQW